MKKGLPKPDLAKVNAGLQKELMNSNSAFEASAKESQRLRGELIKLQEELRTRAADHLFETQGLRQRIDALNYSLVLAQDQVKGAQTRIRRGLKSENFYAGAPTEEQVRWDQAVGRDALALAG